MFNLEFLHLIRDFEIHKIADFFPNNNPRILEIGGGTGFQAKKLSTMGYNIFSIDVPHSNYKEQKEYNVIEYDGHHFPFTDQSFDIVFSSNVLEHIKNLPELHKESLRVLKPNGYLIHVMPSGTWRFWTNLAHYTEMFQKMTHSMKSKYSNSANLYKNLRDIIYNIYQVLKYYACVPRHGETGNAFTEIYTFSKYKWIKHFKENNFTVEVVKPIGLFYTGHMILSKKLSIKIREILSKFLGSACIIYQVRK